MRHYFSSTEHSSIFKSIAPKLSELPNKQVNFSQDRTHLVTSYASPERLANSEANSSPCHISQAGSHLEYRVVSLTHVTILEMRSLGRPLMYSWKKLQRRMESWGAPALTEKSCKHFPRRTNRSYLVDE